MKRQADAENRKANLAKRKADRQSKKEQENEALEQRAKQAKLPHRLDKLPAECLVDVEVVTDRALLQKMDGTQPFVVRDLKLASDALVALHSDDTLRLAHENFQKQYQTTTAFKSTGRAQCGLKPPELNKTVFEAMCWLGPFRSATIKAENMANVDRVSLFGCAAHMHFVANEYEGVGQTRVILSSSKTTYAAPVTEVKQAMAEYFKGEVKTDEDVFKFFRHLTQEQAQRTSLRVRQLAVKMGEAYYLPSGWVMGDFCGEATCTGLRLSTVSDIDVLKGNLRCLAELKDQGPHRENMMKIIQEVEKQRQQRRPSN